MIDADEQRHRDELDQLKKEVDELRKDVRELLDIFKRASGVVTFIKWLGAAATVMAGVGLALKDIFFNHR
jgi:hypothetical protein